jgi:hypothetical protein
MVLFDDPKMRMLLPGQLLMTSPRIMVPPPLLSMMIPALVPVTPAKLSSTPPTEPVWVEPSMVMGAEIVSVEPGLIVWGPAGRILKVIVWGPPGELFASSMAARSVQGSGGPTGGPFCASQIPSFLGLTAPWSPVLVTMKVAASTGPAARTEPSKNEPNQSRKLK